MREGEPIGYFVGPVVRDYLKMLNDRGGNIDPRDRYNIARLFDAPRQMAIAHWAIDRAFAQAEQWQQTREGKSEILVFTRAMVEADSKKTLHKTTVDAADENQLAWLRRWKDLLNGKGAMDNLNRMSQASKDV